MEVLIPAVALGGLYAISKQQPSSNQAIQTNKVPKIRENFESPNPNHMKLPNTNVPDRNYPPNKTYSSETDKSSTLSTINKNASHATTSHACTDSIGTAPLPPPQRSDSPDQTPPTPHWQTPPPRQSSPP